MAPAHTIAVRHGPPGGGDQLHDQRILAQLSEQATGTEVLATRVALRVVEDHDSARVHVSLVGAGPGARGNWAKRLS